MLLLESGRGPGRLPHALRRRGRPRALRPRPDACRRGPAGRPARRAQMRARAPRSRRPFQPGTTPAARRGSSGGHEPAGRRHRFCAV